MQKKEEANENSKQDRIKIVFNDEEETQESQLSIKKRQTTQIIKMDKYFAKEKGLLGKLVELGSFEDTFRNNSYFEDTNNKNVFVPNRMFRSSSKYEYESQDLEIISNASFSALKLNKPKQIVSEDFFDYLNSINCKPQIPVQKLYQELHSHQIEENFENGEIDLDSRCLSNFYINRLRSMFCTDSENPDKSIIYEVKLNRSFNEALRQLHEIRDHINKFILAKEQQKLSELVIDFAEDKQNQFYFLKVFTYKCTEQNVTHIDVNKQTGFICVGDYCKIGRKFSRFNNKTIVNSESIGKVILRKTLLIDKLSENLDEILNPRLYESVLVCPSCYKFYKDKEKQHEERLMKEKLEKESQKIVERRVQKILNQLDPKENKTVSLEKNKSMGNSPRTQPLIVHRRYKSMFLR